MGMLVRKIHISITEEAALITRDYMQLFGGILILLMLVSYLDISDIYFLFEDPSKEEIACLTLSSVCSVYHISE
jgi:hypothetical protein